MPVTPTRIGILLTKLGGMDTRALKYLVLYQNTLQTSFEFQFLPTPEDDSFLQELDAPKALKRETAEKQAAVFISRYREWLIEDAADYELDHELPTGFVILSNAKFVDEYYLTSGDDWEIIALGNWQHHMAPPSLVEFFLSLLIGVAIDFACGDNTPDCHHPTKGCVSDFTASVGDARFSVLTGFLCSACRETIRKATSQQVADDACLLLKKGWLGDASSPNDVANTAKKLGYDLFHTRGIKQTFAERLASTAREEAVRNLFALASAVILAALLLWLGLK